MCGTRQADSLEYWVQLLEMLFSIVPMFNHPRFRIRQKPSACRPSQPIFIVEERMLWWWEDRWLASTFEEALSRVDQLDNAPPPVERKVVYERY